MFKIDRIGLKWDTTTGQPPWTGKIMGVYEVNSDGPCKIEITFHKNECLSNHRTNAYIDVPPY